jgi:hypothetical protein
MLLLMAMTLVYLVRAALAAGLREGLLKDEGGRREDEVRQDGGSNSRAGVRNGSCAAGSYFEHPEPSTQHLPLRPLDDGSQDVGCLALVD